MEQPELLAQIRQMALEAAIDAGRLGGVEAVRALEDVFRGEVLRTTRLTGGQAADICRLFAVALGDRSLMREE